MESKTKVKLSPTDIQRIVNHAFGETAIVSVYELTDGYFNTAYHITMRNGHGQTVLKVGPPVNADMLTYEQNILRAEVDAMKLATADPRIPVPRVIYDDFSRILLPYEYYFMDFVEGMTWDKIRDTHSEAQNNSIEFQLGRITACINAFEHPTFGYFAYGPDFDTWPDAFAWMCEQLFADARRYGIVLDLSEAEFFDKLDEHRAIFAEVTRPRLVHWDLWAGNIFVARDENSPAITGIVDFERSLWGDPLMEAYLARLNNMPNYMAGYGQDLLATHSQRLRRIFYNIYLHLIMVIEDGPRQYEDKGIVRWAQERLSEDIEMLHHGDIVISQ